MEATDATKVVDSVLMEVRETRAAWRRASLYAEKLFNALSSSHAATDDVMARGGGPACELALVRYCDAAIECDDRKRQYDMACERLALLMRALPSAEWRVWWLLYLRDETRRMSQIARQSGVSCRVIRDIERRGYRRIVETLVA